MSALKKAEDQLAGVFKDLPKLPDSSREALVKFWPWLALIGGILQLLAAWSLWVLASRTYDTLNSLSLYLTGTAVGPTGSEKTIIYLGLITLVVDAVILLMAYPGLKARQRRGWDLLFLGALVNTVYAVLQIFTYERGLGSFVFSLLGTAVVFYLLFQIRDKYSKV